VSVGDVRASAPLVRALARDYPGHTILITTMTPTGSATVHELFGAAVAQAAPGEARERQRDQQIKEQTI